MSGGRRGYVTFKNLLPFLTLNEAVKRAQTISIKNMKKIYLHLFCNYYIM